MAAIKRYRAETAPFGKCFRKMAIPAGLGAFAMTVRPPPATAPPTNASLKSSEVPETQDPK